MKILGNCRPALIHLSHPGGVSKNSKIKMYNLLFRCVLDGYGLIWVDHVLNALQMKVSFLIVQKGGHHSVILSMITSESF